MRGPRQDRFACPAVLLLGIVMTIGFSILMGVLASGDIANGTMGEGYSLVRTVLIVGGLAVAACLLIWRSRDRKWLFWIALTILSGFVFGACVMGDLNTSGSSDSTSDVAFAAGGPATLIGALVWWGGARLMRQRTGQRRVPPSLQRPGG